MIDLPARPSATPDGPGSGPVRTLGPYHVIGIVRPGTTTVPALADADDPADAWLDWSAVAPETVTSGPLPALRLVAMTERRPGLRHRAELDAGR